ncbi:MAG: preprotein translocase subunit SecY [Planctomycetota bacterium]|nr:preprotein translocase subunit SecY [Planctomycetota bacterium]
MFSKFANIFRIPELRNKILVTLGLLVIYRVGSFIVIPGIDSTQIAAALETQQQQGGIGGLLNVASALTGGALQNCTLFALGIMPYISASIIFQLLTKVLPALEALSKEGEAGRKKINQYTRYSTVALCMFQGIFILAYIKNPGNMGGFAVVFPDEAASTWWFFRSVLIMATGTVFLMWIGEQISEFGIGNGISLIIMGGIIGRIPWSIKSFIENIVTAPEMGSTYANQTMKMLVFIAMFIAVVVAVVIMTQGQRRIPTQQAKHTRGRRQYGGQRSFLPFSVNSAGVMPVIFAQSLIMLPAMLFAWIGLDSVSRDWFNATGFWYIMIYVVMIFFFTYFWISIMYNPVEMANNLKEYGSFIPGIRPGRRTAEYMEKIWNRVTVAGACFLALIAIIPQLVSSAFEIQYVTASFLGGTGILIVVGVALDLVRKIESHLVMRHYEGFLKGGTRIRGRR